MDTTICQSFKERRSPRQELRIFKNKLISFYNFPLKRNTSFSFSYSDRFREFSRLKFFGKIIRRSVPHRYVWLGDLNACTSNAASPSVKVRRSSDRIRVRLDRSLRVSSCARSTLVHAFISSPPPFLLISSLLLLLDLSFSRGRRSAQPFETADEPSNFRRWLFTWSSRCVEVLEVREPRVVSRTINPVEPAYFRSLRSTSTNRRMLNE